MLKAYKYRLYPTPEQRTLIEKHFGCARWVYNYGLAKKMQAYQQEQKNLSRFDIQAELPLLKKKEETAWLKEVNSQTLQASLENLDKAYTRFFREKKGFPKFKAKTGRQSFSAPQKTSVFWESGSVSVRKIPSIRAELSRRFEGLIKTSTISRTATGKYYISILVDTGTPLPNKPVANIATACGIDLGIKDFATLSTGEKIANPKYLNKHIDRLRMLQRKGRKKIKGSENRKKHNLKVARLHERISNLRNNHLHQLSTRLIKESQFDTFCMEDLNVAGMVRNRKLSRAISDAGWGAFRQMMEYKCEWYGKNLLFIGRFEPSSKMCTCGYVHSELKLSDREWTCPNCNLIHDRDVLAANNIKAFTFHKQNKIPLGTVGINDCGDAALAASAKQ
jgi:putative transposase